MSHMHPPGPPQEPSTAAPRFAEDDVVDDGQEEVFSRTAVARGLVEDPKALSPEQLAQNPKTPKPGIRSRAPTACALTGPFEFVVL